MSEKGRDLDQQKNQAHPTHRDRERERERETERERERERDEETKKKIEPREGKMTITN